MTSSETSRGFFMMMFNEKERLDELESYDVVDAPPQEALDEIVKHVAAILDVPIALVSLVEARRQSFLAKHGLDVDETSRAVSFCDHVVRSRSSMTVEDARRDERFAHNPLVTGDLGILAYMGAPLTTPSGHVLGALCVIDNTRTRRFSSAESIILDTLARATMAHLEARRTRRSHAQFISQLAHDLRGTLATIQGYSELIEESVETGEFEEIGQDIEIIKRANQKLQDRLQAISAPDIG